MAIQLRFGRDIWSPAGQLYDHLLQPIDQAQPAARTSAYYTTSGWSFQALRNLLPQSVLQAIAPIHVTPDHAVMNKPIWGLSSTGTFSISSISKACADRYPARIGTFSWKLLVPPHTKTFLWTFLHGRLLTNQYHFHCKVTPNPAWVICDASLEDIDHVFQNCGMAKQLWRRCGYPAQLVHSFQLPLIDWLLVNLQSNIQLTPQIQWTCYFATTLWFMWK